LAKSGKSPNKKTGGVDGETENEDSRAAKKKKRMDEKLEISSVKKANEDAFFNKWMKQRES